MQGLGQGFHVGLVTPGVLLHSRKCNHPSALERGEVVSTYVRSELSASRIVGTTYIPAVCDYVHCSPVGLVPKGRDSGKWRMIVMDLSYPDSVNDGIQPDCMLFTCSILTSIDDALQFINTLGWHPLLTKSKFEECLSF